MSLSNTTIAGGSLGNVALSLRTPFYVFGAGSDGLVIHDILFTGTSVGAIGSGCYIELSYKPQTSGAYTVFHRWYYPASTPTTKLLQFRHGLFLPRGVSSDGRWNIKAQVKAANGSDVTINFGTLFLGINYDSY